MKFSAVCISVFFLAIVSCERHNIEDAKKIHLYDEHHGAHGDDHKEKSGDHGNHGHGGDKSHGKSDH